MRKDEALKLIDDHKNGLKSPVQMLHWTWLRVIVAQIADDEWETLVSKATFVLSQ